MQRYVMGCRRGTSDCFFESEEGQPLMVSGLGQFCERVAKRARVTFHPHMARHTFSIAYLRSGGSAFALQKSLSHTTLDTPFVMS